MDADRGPARRCGEGTTELVIGLGGRLADEAFVIHSAIAAGMRLVIHPSVPLGVASAR